MKRSFCLFLAGVISLSPVAPAAWAQGAPQGAPVPAPAPASFSQAELDQLLAPIALYPDPLLGHVLMASTYPLETVQAARFAAQHPGLKGDALAQAVAPQPWDPSVKALVEFPSVLAMMNDRLDWTQKLGDAFLAQQGAVMDTVQNLRAKAQAAGTLRSNQQQRVVVQNNAIDIEPYAPDVIYVPYYNPSIVYGGWWWPDRPPMIWLPPPMYRSPSFGDMIVAGVAFGVGVAIIGSIFGEARPDWRAHHFFVGNRYGGNGPGTIWAHDPAHRHGVAYRDMATRSRFLSAPNAVNREAFRGHLGSTPLGRAAANSTFHAGPARSQAAMHPAGGQGHPFAPAGPASIVQSHADRGRASREAFTPHMAAQSQHAPMQHAQPQHGGAGHPPAHQQSR